MKLPVMPPVAPMLARPVAVVPAAGSYEPKWDGFRSIIFRDGDEVEIGSRNERPMTRYFPELVAAFRAELPDRCVVDGEIVCARSGWWRSATTTWRGSGFRHTAQFIRWRPDRTPASCTFAQLDQPVSYHLNDIVPGLRPGGS